MKFLFNRIRFRNRRRQQPNPDQWNPNSVLNCRRDGAVSGRVRAEEIEEEEEGYETCREGSLDTVTEGEYEEIEQGDSASSSLRNTVNYGGSGSGSISSSMSLVECQGKQSVDTPPTDDCCPICFGNFVVPCRGPCGHWYCGGCILQYWNYSAALKACNCPMCSRPITKLTPEASLIDSHEAEVSEVWGNVQRYNRLFVGGIYGFALRLLELPLYIRRMSNEMINPDRPGAHLNKLRIFAMILGLLYTFSPVDFLRIGRQNVIDIFDYSAIALSFVLYLVGLYLQRRRFQHVREIAPLQPQPD